MLDLVRSKLYPDTYLTEGAYPFEQSANRLLAALGTIVMAAARESVAQVFTLNFDDVLEWYLRLHGFRAQVVSDLPRRLLGSVDVQVFHPHGYLPLEEASGDRTEWLVISKADLVDRLRDQHGPWGTVLRGMFMSNMFLAVGTSLRDIDIDVHLAAARQGFALGVPLGFVVNAQIEDTDRERLIDAQLVPVSLPDLTEIPEFLLGVAQVAARAGTS